MQPLQRQPYSAYAFIILLTVFHFFEAFLLAYGIKDADWTFPFRSFLFPFNGNHPLAALALGGCSLCGLAALVFSNIHKQIRFSLFVIQSIPIWSAVLWVVAAILSSRNAYGGYEHPIAVFINQEPRLVTLVLYPIAVRSIVGSK